MTTAAAPPKLPDPFAMFDALAAEWERDAAAFAADATLSIRAMNSVCDDESRALNRRNAERHERRADDARRYAAALRSAIARALASAAPPQPDSTAKAMTCESLGAEPDRPAKAADAGCDGAVRACSGSCCDSPVWVIDCQCCEGSGEWETGEPCATCRGSGRVHVVRPNAGFDRLAAMTAGPVSPPPDSEAEQRRAWADERRLRAEKDAGWIRRRAAAALLHVEAGPNANPYCGNGTHETVFECHQHVRAILHEIVEPEPRTPTSQPAAETPNAPGTLGAEAFATAKKSEPTAAGAGSDEPAHRDPDERVKKGFRIGIEAALKVLSRIEVDCREYGETDAAVKLSRAWDEIRDLAAPRLPASQPGDGGQVSRLVLCDDYPTTPHEYEGCCMNPRIPPLPQQ